ncbi:carboxymuconolactone decarboxylase family protein [Aeromicrobium phragmitis]|uniref:Carboxymuconolactone decarboxylase family protein n=1 Tax=Aeromicrobium phragmitis TaxID=2478914 RepID=A0A3L8PIU5_9ACTN|nr:carboxymuconolactone decarboxylase family protein [Aeromicrobium phragmitis]RLV55094.1 carboxymuconolactone decarboxylase family protein [Aeromicrobium phragmitis]
MTLPIAPLAPADAGPLTRLAYRVMKRRFGAVAEPFAVAAHHPPLMRLSIAHELGLERASRGAPTALYQLAVYRAAWTIGCSWCVDFGAMLQRLDGLDVERLQRIDEYETAEEFSDDERLVQRLTDAMSATPAGDATDLVAELVDRIGREATLTLVYQIAHENHRARMNHALGITDQGFSSGAACRVPWETTARA